MFFLGSFFMPFIFPLPWVFLAHTIFPERSTLASIAMIFWQSVFDFRSF